MSDIYWLTDAQMERLKPFFPVSHGKPRVDDRRFLSGTVFVFVNRNGLRWCDAPKDYGPAKPFITVGSAGARMESLPGSWSAWPPKAPSTRRS